MAKPVLLLLFFLSSSLIVGSLLPVQSLPLDLDSHSTYIVHVSPSRKPFSSRTHLHWYSCLLRRSAPAAAAPPATVLYSYSRAAHGFSASLSPAHAATLRSHPDVLSVVPDRARHPHTTHTPAFLRLSDSSGLWPASNYAADVIVGMLDTGVWPISRASFSGADLPPPPSSWRGRCESSKDFNASLLCNNKLIGAKAFFRGYEAALGRPIDETKESKSPLDTEGHGTHTASTAAGADVKGAGFFTYARGEARGMAARARLAVYKICWASGCYDSDILAAMDAAVADGVDVISLSVGASGYSPAYYRDSIAIGAFGAARHGVLVSCSAGNSGPGPLTAVNIAPWILTVGASTIDREFPADVILGDGSIYGGVSLYAGEPLQDAYYPLVYGGDCGSRLCLTGQLDASKVAGKIVLCDRGGNARVEKGSAVKLASGAGMIMANTEENGEELLADSHLVPATMVGQSAGDKIRAYIRSATDPTATINFRGTVISPSPPSPQVAAFSSRGPSIRSPEILKPDIIAPGVNILAAWTGHTSPTDLEIDPRRVEFNIVSGTSMSCPHASGLAALLRKAYPNWSPAAVKSALITTAYNVDNSGEFIKDLATGGASTPFIRGAGHVDPNRALDPGLIYDTDIDGYIAFLCALGYDAQQIAVFTRDEVSVACSSKALANPGDLNYPSFSVVFDSNSSVITYKRVVRNVGSSGKAVYEASISSPPGVNVTVAPSKLEFDAAEQSLGYAITFASTSDSSMSGSHSFGSIEWSDGVHIVRSPIAITWSESVHVVRSTSYVSSI